MAKQLGRKMLVKYLSSAAGATKAYTTVAAINSKTITVNNGTIDVTTGDDDDIWMDTLQGIKSMTLSADGVFTDNAAENKLEEVAQSGTPRIELQILIPDYVTLTGVFHIDSFEFGGEIEGAVTFSISLSSVGEITRATV